MDGASLCVHPSMAGWILLAQAARANNRLTHSLCCVCERHHNVTKQLSLFICREDVLMLKGQTPAAMLLFLWLALYTPTPASTASPPSLPPSPTPLCLFRAGGWFDWVLQAILKACGSAPPSQCVSHGKRRCTFSADTASPSQRWKRPDTVVRSAGAGRMTFLRAESRTRVREEEEAPRKERGKKEKGNVRPSVGT